MNAETPIALSNPKRRARERKGLHAWFPYYAGFAEQFVHDALKHLELPSDSIVLDPMNGSGTSTMVAQQSEYLALGFDLNPVMVAIARAKNRVFVDQKKLVTDAAEAVVEAAKRTRGEARDLRTGQAGDWYGAEVYSDLIALKTAILSEAGPHSSATFELDDRLITALNDGCLDDLNCDPSAFLKAVLLRTARSFSAAKKSKNPTWLKAGDAKDNMENGDALECFRALAKEMLEELQGDKMQPSKSAQAWVLEGNATELPLQDNCIGGIVTSPPYLTRIDYAVSTAPELAVLGYEDKAEFRKLREEIMGSTCITGGDREPQDGWGETCLNLLKQIRGHDSKAAKSYYLPNHIQYFRDAYPIVKECLRVLEPGGRALFVVQDSWFKDVHVRLNVIYEEMAKSLGAQSAETIHSYPVRSHLGLVNRGARKYKKGTVKEHVVQFEKGAS